MDDRTLLLTVVFVAFSYLYELVLAALVVVLSHWAYRARGYVTGYWFCAVVVVRHVLAWTVPVAQGTFQGSVPTTLQGSSLDLVASVSLVGLYVCGFLSQLAIWAMFSAEVVHACSDASAARAVAAPIAWTYALYARRHLLGVLALALIVVPAIAGMALVACIPAP